MMWCILGELGSLKMTLDDISGEGDSYDFREGGSSEDWEIKERRNDRREAQVW